MHAVHIQILDDGSRESWILGGYYHDVMAQHPEGWRIRERIARATHEIGTFRTEGVRRYPTLPDYAEMGQI